MDNRHSQAIPEQVLADAQKKIDEVAAALASYFMPSATTWQRWATSRSLSYRRHTSWQGKTRCFVRATWT